MDDARIMNGDIARFQFQVDDVRIIDLRRMDARCEHVLAVGDFDAVSAAGKQACCSACRAAGACSQFSRVEAVAASQMVVTSIGSRGQ